MADLEAHGGHGPSDMLKDELTRSLEELEALLKAKDEVRWQETYRGNERYCRYITEEAGGSSYRKMGSL